MPCPLPSYNTNMTHPKQKQNPISMLKILSCVLYSGSSYGDDDYDDHLAPDATTYSKDSNVLKKNHPLFIMVSHYVV